MKDPSLVEIFNDGGPLMLLALVWMILFIVVSFQSLAAA